ncbi:MAG: hypothetical protein HWN67_12025 [Candidatus Helarchaeota archaeon]|nr:hypothetical protein [Candidatus Helarchaeota archaeon]
MSQNLKKINELKNDSKAVNTEIKVIRKLDEREVFNKKKRIQQRVSDFLVGDETGVFTLTAWDLDIDKIADRIGKSILIMNGYVNVFMERATLNIGMYGQWKPIDKEIEVTDIPEELPKTIQWFKVKDLKERLRNVNIIVKVKEKAAPRDVRFKDGSMHRVATASVGDTTGLINLSLFDAAIESVNEGEIYELKNGYVSKFQNNLQLNIGKYGQFTKIDHEDFEINTTNLM